MKIDANRILLVLHGSIGDVTRAIPLANLVRRRYSGAHIAWAIEPAAAPLIEHHPALDEIIVFDRPRGVRAFVSFLKRIRSRRFELVLDLQRHLKSGVISWSSRAPVRIGFHRRDAKECNWLFNNRTISATPADVSKLAHYLKFAEFLGIAPEPVEWRFHLLPDERAAVERRLEEVGGPFAAYCVGGRWESKRWFPAEAARSAAEIGRRHGLKIVLLGGGGDAGFAAEMERSAAGFINWVGRTSLREVIGILARAEFSVGPDSGLMHISAAVGTPVISLWGPTDPQRTGPYGYGALAVRGEAPCAPCYLKRCPIGRVCMQSIRSENVLAKVEAALSRRAESHGAAR